MKNCETWTLRQTNSISSYILNEKNCNRSEEYPVSAMSLNANKIIETEQCFICPLSSPILWWLVYTQNEAATLPMLISILIGL